MVTATLDAHGRGRDVRRRRRRVPPLLGGRALARARTSRRCSTTTPLLASTYLHAWVVTGRERYREVVEETLDYVLRELALPDGGLASAQDADTDGVEGLTYTWTPEEAAAVGLPRELLEPFEHGRYVVRGELEPELRARVLAERATRPQPFRDDKALASWNGLALAALAEAGYRLERRRLCSPLRAASGSSCSARSRARTGGCFARVATAA